MAASSFVILAPYLRVKEPKMKGTGERGREREREGERGREREREGERGREREREGERGRGRQGGRERRERDKE